MVDGVEDGSAFGIFCGEFNDAVRPGGRDGIAFALMFRGVFDAAEADGLFLGNPHESKLALNILRDVVMHVGVDQLLRAQWERVDFGGDRLPLLSEAGP